MVKIVERTEDGISSVHVILEEKDSRVCDYCNKLLMEWDKDISALVTVRDCATTEYGLMCEDCRENIRAIQNFEVGDPVVAHPDGSLKKVP